MSITTYLAGEAPLPEAPTVRLKNGNQAVPQQFLRFEHSLHSVHQIVSDCDYRTDHIIFVGEEEGFTYVQVGMIGFDNYKARSKQRKKKIVYGRKWLIEGQMPSSEIIQTVFLALKKASEHEIREHFSLNVNGTVTTPLSTHLDLPLLAANAELIHRAQEYDDVDDFVLRLRGILAQLKFDHKVFSLEHWESRQNGQVILDINLASTIKSEQTNETISLMMDVLSIDEFLYELMNRCIQISERAIEETFTYKGFARFSRKNSVLSLALISKQTRDKELIDNDNFSNTVAKYNLNVDTGRAPRLTSPAHVQAVKTQLEAFGHLAGVMPKI